MVVGELASTTDVAVIGAGPGGYVAALGLARAGRDVTLIDRAEIGGTCLNIGCIPSKALLHAADIAALPRSTTNTGVTVSTAVDVDMLRAHIGAVVGQLTSGVRRLLDDAGVTVLQGTAHFARPNRLAIEADDGVTHLEFDHAIAATGSRPIELPALPVGVGPVVDSTGALALPSIPETLVVVGAGYIGVELGTAYAKLGSRVTLVEAADRILPGLPASLIRPVAAGLRKLDIEVLTDARAAGLTDDGTAVIVEHEGDQRRLPAELVIVAVGRRPATDGLGLDKAGARLTDSGHVVVDDVRRAGPRLFAIGDLTEGPALAHKATAEAHVVVDALLGRSAGFDPAAIPAVVFSDPEVATVGHTVDTASDAGIDARAFRFPFTALGRALTLGRTDGHVELVADAADTVIGAHIVGHGAADLIAEAGLAIEMAATIGDVAETIHAHPTSSEALAEAALGLSGQPLHVNRR